MKKAFINGKRWMDSNGNTYHTSEIFIDDNYYKTDRTYGYGNQFKHTAIELLKKEGYNIDDYMIIDIVVDVKRKKDL